MNTDASPAGRGRREAARARRLVVKVGTRVLVEPSGRPDLRRIGLLVRELAALRRAGREVVLVTSGAIGAGMEALGMARRPVRLPELQMAAAVGQNRLMARYDRLFARERCTIGQVLLTHDDLKHRTRHLNARRTMLAMLKAGVIPVVNENDAVAVDEIKFGDNDLLASLVVQLIDADLLILLTTSDGLRAPAADGTPARVPFLDAITPAVLKLAAGKGSALSSGGMASKLEAARLVARNGTAVVIADGRSPDILARLLAGEDTGTWIRPAAKAALPKRKRWIAYFHKPLGVLTVDEGAQRAIQSAGKSLLAIGIRDVQGDFPAGAAVDIRAPDQSLIARGLVSYSSRDIRRVQGRRSDALAAILGAVKAEEIVHHDNMAVLSAPGRTRPPESPASPGAPS